MFPSSPHYSTKTVMGLSRTSSSSLLSLYPVLLSLLALNEAKLSTEQRATTAPQEFTLEQRCRESRENERRENIHRGVFPPLLPLLFTFTRVFEILVAFVQVSTAHSYTSTFISSSWLNLAMKSCNRQLVLAVIRKKKDKHAASSEPFFEPDLKGKV